MQIVLARMAAGLTMAVALAAGSAISLADVIYVSDAADITSTMRSAQPGDTLVMRNGTWTEEITFEGHGTAEQPITLRAQTPGRVILTGPSRLRIGGSYLIVTGLYFKDGHLDELSDPSRVQAVVEFRTRPSSTAEAHHCRLTNSVIENYNPEEITNRYFWVLLYGTRNRVDRCTFKGKTNNGTLLNVVRSPQTPQAQYHQIDHNYFVDRPLLGGTFGGEIIVIGESRSSLSDSRTTVQFNLFERCDGDREIISSKSGKNRFRYNTFVRSRGALTLRHGNGALVEGNFFFGDNLPNTGGVRVIGENHVLINNYFSGIAGSSDTFRSAVTLFDGVDNSPLEGHFQVKNALIAFNTFIENGRNIIIGGGRAYLTSQYGAERVRPPLNSTIANNIVMKDAAPGDDCLINVVHEPIYRNPSRPPYEGNIMYGPCLGISEDTDGVFVMDPQLVLAGDGLYRPDSDSPAIDNAVGDYPMVTTDMDGQPRDDGFKDIGADEVSTAPITRRPLTARDVGANWARRP
jgi:poly(beta-D-mannuronate) lyase